MTDKNDTIRGLDPPEASKEERAPHDPAAGRLQAQ